jgi:hypothetical protein
VTVKSWKMSAPVTEDRFSDNSPLRPIAKPVCCGGKDTAVILSFTAWKSKLNSRASRRFPHCSEPSKPTRRPGCTTPPTMSPSWMRLSALFWR